MTARIITASNGRKTRLRYKKSWKAPCRPFSAILYGSSARDAPIRAFIAVNSRLPRDIAILSAEEVDADFHSRFSAEEKTYAYQLLISECPDPFVVPYVWQVKKPLKLDLMRDALDIVVGTHDFSSFEASGSAVRDPVRTIYEATLTEEGASRVTIRLRGNGFLYHMVRNIVGTLVDVGLGRTSVEGFRHILEAHDRRLAGVTAPPQGLFLENVRYPKKYYKKDENTP